MLVDADLARRARAEALLRADAGIRVAGAVAESFEALPVLDRHQPRVLLLEAAQIMGSGEGVLALLHARAPNCHSLLLAAGEPEDELVALLLEGARGFLDFEDRPWLLTRAVHALAAGEAWVPRRAVGRLLDLAVQPRRASVGAVRN